MKEEKDTGVPVPMGWMILFIIITCIIMIYLVLKHIKKDKDRDDEIKVLREHKTSRSISMEIIRSVGFGKPSGFPDHW